MFLWIFQISCRSETSACDQEDLIFKWCVYFVFLTFRIFSIVYFFNSNWFQMKRKIFYSVYICYESFWLFWLKVITKILNTKIAISISIQNCFAKLIDNILLNLSFVFIFKIVSALLVTSNTIWAIYFKI